MTDDSYCFVFAGVLGLLNKLDQDILFSLHVHIFPRNSLCKNTGKSCVRPKVARPFSRSRGAMCTVLPFYMYIIFVVSYDVINSSMIVHLPGPATIPE
jgi:hypothetical protein